MQISTDPEILKWVHVRINRVPPDPNLSQCLGFLIDGKKAGVTYSNFNGYNCDIAVAVDDGFQWTRTALRALFSYPFEQLGLNRITALVEQGNHQSQQFCERLGCTLEARLAYACASGDLLLYRMTRDECRWVNHVSKSFH